MDALFNENPADEEEAVEDTAFIFPDDGDDDISALLEQVTKSELKAEAAPKAAPKTAPKAAPEIEAEPEAEAEADASCNALGSFIKAMRIKRGLRLSDLAEISGISSCVLSQTENGKLPSEKICDKLIDAFTVNDEDRQTENLTSNIKLISQLLAMLCRSDKLLSVMIDMMDDKKEDLDYAATVLKALMDAKR